MNTRTTAIAVPSTSSEWVAFPGGELEGRRPRVLCSGCREQLRRTVASRSIVGSFNTQLPGGAAGILCFDCHRAERARDRALRAAGELDTASDARFQSVLPLEPVNQSRLVRLRTERAAVRASIRTGAGVYGDRRRQAQIAARRALQTIREGLRRRNGGLEAGAAQSASPSGATNRSGMSGEAAVGRSMSSQPVSSGQLSSRQPGNRDTSRPGISDRTVAGAEPRQVFDNEIWTAIHAAELQLPETWLPFVTAR